MPHVIIEYSSNLEEHVDLAAFLEHVHQAALACGAFPLPGLRTRAARRDRYRIADGHPANAFVHVVARVAPGRSLEVRHAAGRSIFEAITSFLAPQIAQMPLAITFEMHEIEMAVSFRENNLAAWLERRRETG